MSDESLQRAMQAPIRRLDVGENQGRGNPPSSRYHVETATVAKVKCSTPRYPPESTRGLLVSRWFYIGGAASAGIVAILGWGAWKLVNL